MAESNVGEVNRDPVIDARELIAELFPQARWALVTGSVTTAQRTTGSDLDIVVVLPDGDRRLRIAAPVIGAGGPSSCLSTMRRA